MGLGRAFLFAGAKAVVLSLWEVKDTKSTLSLISDFYESFLKQHEERRNLHGGAAAALREAMQNAKRNGTPVPDWASFYVLGAG